MNSYFLHIVLVLFITIILFLLIITAISYYYIKYQLKNKNILLDLLLLYKVNAKKLKETSVKNRNLYYLDDLININDLDFKNTILHEKLYEDISDLSKFHSDMPLFLKFVQFKCVWVQVRAREVFKTVKLLLKSL